MKDMEVLRTAVEALERDLKDPREVGGSRRVSGKRKTGARDGGKPSRVGR